MGKGKTQFNERRKKRFLSLPPLDIALVISVCPASSTQTLRSCSIPFFLSLRLSAHGPDHTRRISFLCAGRERKNHCKQRNLLSSHFCPYKKFSLLSPNLSEMKEKRKTWFLFDRTEEGVEGVFGFLFCCLPSGYQSARERNKTVTSTHGRTETDGHILPQRFREEEEIWPNRYDVALMQCCNCVSPLVYVT